jgi:4-amino-4-deoxy-L-arabinose transferase-like glycosyltransferase
MELNGATTQVSRTLPMKRWIEQNRILFILNSFAFLCIATAWILYALFGHRIIEAMYKGESIEFLNSIIEGQSIHPLPHYLQDANDIMWFITLVVVASSSVLTLLIKTLPSLLAILGSAAPFLSRCTITVLSRYSFLSATVEKLSKSDLVLFSLIILGITTRMINLNQSLFVDEAWVANSVLTPSLHEMFLYDNWLQTSPPLFLLLVRYTAKVLGTSDLALRAVPSFFGMLSIIVMAIIGRRVLDRTSAILCVALLVTSTAAYHWEILLKQYSSDLFVSLFLLWMIYRYLDAATRRNYVLMVCAFAVGVLLSYTAMFLVPGGIYALLCGGGPARKNRTDGARGVVTRLTVFLLLLVTEVYVNLVIFIRPNVNPELVYYWFTDFPKRIAALELAKYYLGTSQSLASAFLIPYSFLTAERSAILLGVLCVGMLKFLMSAFERGSRERHFFCLSLLLLTSVIGANLLGQYPYGDERTSLFLFPTMILLFVAGLEAIRDGVMGSPLSDGARKWGSFLVQCVCVAVVMGFLSFHVLHYPKSASEDDAEDAIKYLMVSEEPGDSVYVHASMFEQFKFYHGKMPGKDGVAYYYGNTGWRCCTRRNGSYYTDKDDYSGLRKDLKSFLSSKKAGTTWFIFIDRPGDWYWRDDPKFVKGVFESVKCGQTRETKFRGALIYGFHCEPDVSGKQIDWLRIAQASERKTS